jgi:hypothetical protein
MTQEQLNNVFKSDLGQQLDSFFTVSYPEGFQVFIRIEEAIDFVTQHNLPEDSIDEYYAEYSGKDEFPIARKFES